MLYRMKAMLDQAIDPLYQAVIEARAIRTVSSVIG